MPVLTRPPYRKTEYHTRATRCQVAPVSGDGERLGALCRVARGGIRTHEWASTCCGLLLQSGVVLLERLSEVPCREVMRSPAVVFVGAETMALRDAAGRRRFIYVIERDGRLGEEAT